MPRAACSFRQTDVVRAIKAARTAGVEVARVVIDKNGTITIIAGKSEPEPAEVKGGTDEWDRI